MRNFVIFLLGLAAFIVCLKFTPIGFWLSLIVGTGSLILLGSLSKFLRRESSSSSGPVTHEEVKASEVVKKGMNSLREISNQTRFIRNNEVAGKIREICRIGVEIFDEIKREPKDLRKARQFINYYLDTTEKIVKRYVELSSKKESNPEIEETMKKVEESLDSIKDTYQKQLNNLLEDDLLDINTEIEVLKKTMKLEG